MFTPMQQLGAAGWLTHTLRSSGNGLRCWVFALPLLAVPLSAAFNRDT